MVINYSKRLLACMVICILFTSFIYSQSITNRDIFSGKINYTLAGSSFRDQPTDNSGTPASLVTNSSIVTSAASNLTIPSGVNVVKAYLYWAHGNTVVDNTVTFQDPLGTLHTVVADNTYGDPFDATETYFSCVTDVTTIVNSGGSGNYTMTNLDIENTSGTSWYNFGTVSGSWLLVVVYEDTIGITDTYNINVYDGLKLLYNGAGKDASATFNLGSLNIGLPVEGSLTMYGFEGDNNPANTGEGVLVNTNQMSNVLGTSFGMLHDGVSTPGNVATSPTRYGIDVEEYNITPYISNGDTAIDVQVQTGTDQIHTVMFITRVISNDDPVVNNDVGEATQGVATTIDLAGNDTDPNGNLDLTSITIVGGNTTSKGSISVNNDGTIIYTSSPTATGTDTITYEICDSSNPTPLCSQASLTVNINKDTDGDGVADKADLDNDNDGVLDTNEGVTACSGVVNWVITPNSYSEGTTVPLNINLTTGGTIAGATAATSIFTTNIDNVEIIAASSTTAFGVSFNATGAISFTNAASAGNDEITVQVDLDKSEPIEFEWGAGVFNLRETYTIEYDSGAGLATVSDPANQITETITAGQIIINSNQEGGANNITPVNATFSIQLPEVSSFTIKRTDVVNGNAVPSGGGLKIVLDKLCDIDTDSDGIPDHLDVDSDNDGCYDALEASGSYNHTQLSLGIFTGGVDANGVPLTSTGGQSTSAAVIDNTDSSACCDSSVSGLPDVDGDGVVNICDLDNDNDGILDSTECGIKRYQYAQFNGVPGTFTATATYPSGGTVNINLVHAYTKNGVPETYITDASYPIHGTAPHFEDKFVTETNLNSEVGTLESGSTSALYTWSNHGGSGDFRQVMEFDFLSTTTGFADWKTVFGISGNYPDVEGFYDGELIFTAIKLDGSPETDFSGWRFVQPVNPSQIADGGPSTFVEGNVPYNGVTSKTSNFTIDVGNVEESAYNGGNDSTIGFILIPEGTKYQKIYLERHIVATGLTYQPANYNSTEWEYSSLTIAERTSVCDFDSDEIPNYLDIDSDNDGCKDTIESGGVDGNDDGILDGTGFDANGQVTGGSGGYDGVSGNETVATQVTVDATALVDQSVNTGDPTSFTITSATATSTSAYTGTPPATTPDYSDSGATDVSAGLVYQWQEDGVDLTTTGVYTGVTTSTLNISDVTGLSGKVYNLVVSHPNTGCVDVQNSARLTEIDPCTDGAIVGTPTANDPDGDGINNSCDLDDDNDGILDSDECGLVTLNINWADLGLTDVGISSASGQTIPDIGAVLGIPELNGIGITVKFSFTGSSTPASNLIGAVGSPWLGLANVIGGTRKIEVSFTKSFEKISLMYDGQFTDGEFVMYGPSGGVLLQPTGPISGIDITAQGVSNPVGGVGTTTTSFPRYEISNEANIEVISGISSGGISTSSQNGVLLQIKYRICDTDRDSVQNILDLDSDNDGCNDVIESGGIDANDDGILDGTGFDANGQVTGGSGGYDGVSGNETVATQVTVDATALVDQSVNTGDPTSFTITSATATSTSAYTGTPPATTPDYSDSGATDVSAGLVYQWQEDGVDLTTTGVYTGVTTSTLNISDVTGLSGKVYNLVVSHPNIGCVDVQNSARLTEIDPCTDGAIVGTPTANDPDGDGINNSCDLDDDNDGILDSDECGLVTLNINWADLGLTDVGISSASGQTIPDIGAVLGIPELNGIGITVKFSFTGSSTPASNLIGAVGSPWLGLANVIGGTRKIEVSFTKSFEKISLMYDGQFTDGEFVMCGPSGGVLLQPTGPISGIDITAQGVSNPVGGVGTTTTSFPRYEISNEANIEVISGISSGGISTSSQNGVLLQIKYRICDTDRDGIQNILDLDSDNDGCNDVIESGGIDANDDGILDGTGFDANGQVTGGSGGYDGVSGNETVATQVTVDATALVDQSVNTGDPTSFTITSATATSTSAYTGTPPATTPDYSDSGATDVSAGLVYQWQEDGVDLTTTGVYTGVTTSTLNISDVTGLSGKVYNLVVSHPNIGCVDVQNSARLTEIDPCTDGAIVGTPTANDPDGDGINNSCDLDDDNDGILDSDECGLVTLNINWADLGLTDVGISSASGQTIPDIGAVLGIPELNGIGITVKFSFTGSSTPASNLIGAVGSPWLGLANVIGGTRKIEVSFTKSFEKISLMYDGQFTDGEFVMCGPSGGVLLQPTGPISGIDITAQGVSNPVGGVGTTTTSFPRYEISNEANIEVISGISSGGISTSSQNGVLLQIKYRICDTDRDGIQNILDLDSDNDGCNDVIESGGIDANDDGILDGTGFDANGQVTGGSGGYDGVTGTEIVPTQVTVDATALVDQSVNTGDPTSFTITSATAISTSAYTGTPPATTPDYSDPGATDVSAGLVYQWQEDGVDLTNTGVYSGVTTSTLNISDVTGLSGKVYNLVVSHPNTGCVDVQNSATLTEVNPCTVGAIVGTPTANDPDADGINNSCDLDDDNDGILDINEMSTVSAICTFSATKNTALYTPVFSIPTPVPSITTLFTGVDAFSLPYFPDPVPSVTSTVTSSAEIIGASGSGVSDLTILDVYVDLSSQTNVQFQIISGSQWDHDYLFMDEFGNPSNAVEVANISTKSGTSSSLTTPINPTGTVFLRLYNFDEFNSNNGAIWWKSTENPTLQLLEGTTMPVCNNLMDIDTDGDGIPNRLDADSDNDGCNDVIESGGVDANDDGVLDGTGFDANGQVTGGSGGYDGVLGIEIVPTQVTVDATALVDQSVNTGDPTSFTITSATAISTSAYTGTAPTTTPDYSDAGATDVSAGLVYQWQEDGVNLTNTGVYSGVTTSTLNISNVTGLSGKVYNLVITHPNAACVGIQNSAILTESDPCSDGATIGTPTANDPDGDGINNVCDLDDDNDGILDDAECARVKVTPADLSTPPGGNASNYSITNDDISSLFGLPTGSIFVTITNGATNSAGLAWKTNATEGNAIFEFSGPYADLAFVTIAHGGSLAQGLQDGFIALDGVEYDFQTTLIDDYFTANTGNTYYVENPVGGTATSNGVRFEWIAKQPGAKRMEIFATGATGNSQYFVELRLCDADRDMVLDHLDVDSDNDGCNDVTESGGTDGDSDGILDGTGFDSNGQVTGGVGGYDGVNGNEVEATMLQVDTQPTDATICPEASTTFTGAASSLSTTTFTGTAPSTTPDYSGSTPATADLAYHWQEQVGGSGPWNNISDGGIYGGATTVSLTLTNVPLSASTNKYRLLVTSTKNVCASETSSEVTLTVNPEPVNSTPPTETVCSDVALNHDLTADVTLTGNTFSWSAADNVNVTGETTTVSTAANITDTLTNVSGSVQTVVYTITPTSAAGCAGDSYIYTVTVNPEPVNNTPPTDTVCSDVALNHDLTADVTFTGNTFSWSAADNANVTGETTSVSTATSITDTLTNTSGSVQTVVYTITPTGSNGCAGDSYTYTVTVNPEPFVATAPTGTVCSDVALSHDLTGDVNVAGTTFSWSAADNANVTGETTSASTATSITDTLTNTSGSVQTVVYTITPTSADGCVGDSYTYTVTVNPEPFVAAAPTDTVCSNIALTHDLTSDVNVAGTTFSWSAADNANVTGESLTAQTTSTIGDTLINTSNSVQTVVYTIIPTSSNGCLGSSYTYTVTLSPQDFVAVDPSDHICSNSSLAHDLTSDTPVVGTTFSWSAAENTDVTGETTSASTATSITDTLINTSNSVQTVVYTITPTSPDGCAGDSYTYTVTIDPQDFVATNPTVTITSGETLSHNLAADTSVAGTTFSWSAADNTNVTGETITSSTASTIGDALVNITKVNQTVVYSITPTSADGCTGDVYTLTVTILSDTDGDGVADDNDLDSDNDGILDNVEQNGDPNRDTDSDGIPDHLDLDSDGDGILDLVESGQDAAVVDANGDGVLDSTTDADNDGILDTADADDNNVNAGGSITPTDSDGDGTSDFQDVDSDNDGVSDLVEGGTDASLDANNDGILDDQTDTDGDGLADSVDPDNGGTAAGTPDTDGDGLPDYQDLDSDGDGINDVVEAGGADTDNNGQIDTGGTLLDGTNLPDSSGNGTSDVLEPNNPDLPGSLDANGDGVIDDQTDSDGDGIADSVDGLVGFGDAEQTDTDGDGIADIHDLDSDNDGILDSVEQNGDPNRDTDSDGILDHLDLDSDGDGILDLVESGQDASVVDTNGDGVLDSTTDADNDGILDTADNDDNDINAGGSTTPTDSDGDGMPDFQDTDSDNDGVSDLIEGGGDPSLDTDNDGVIDDQTDTDGDGLADSVDPDNGGTSSTGPDTDGDGLPDYQDLDSDGDGINDVDEAGGTDTDGDGQIDTGDLVDGNNLPDTDGDGTPDVEEPNNPDLPGNLDLDGDGVIDDQTDSDGDGIADSVDGLVGFGDALTTDTDGDGIEDLYDLDSDNDGILDSVEQGGDPDRDTDGDGIPDHLDLDSDGDGILDIVESGQDAATLDADGDGMLDSTIDADNDGIVDTADNDDNDINAGGSTTPTDSDGDGMPDFQDTDSDNDGVSDLIEGGGDPSLDADNDGVIDDQTDTDGDGLADSVDPDNGGTAAGTPDSDGDGLPDYRDLDSDGDGINDVVEAGGADTDNNGQIDTGGTLLDGTNLPDSSGNGTPDVLEPNNPDLPGSLDANGDGVVDDQTDTDGDGIADSVDGLVGFGDAEQTDTDGDGIADIHDLDSDNDGILDSVEQNGDPNRDTDNDGIPDHLDLDSDGDGILDLVESGQDALVVDTNGDGVLDSTTDADNDGILDTADADDADVNAGGSTTPTDSDGDGTSDFQDVDSDNDGVSDLVEGGTDPNLDANNDGILDDQTDMDGDGLADSVDPDNGGTAAGTPDTDGDGLPDYQDLDSDGDGINDVVEAGGTDTDNNGQIDTGGTLLDGTNLPDSSGNGTPDVEEPNNPDLPGNLDLDGDGVIDDQTDSDGDGIADSVDGLDGFGDAEQTDTDGDGIADIHDLDSDNDGILDSVEQDGDPNRDTDGDGIPDHLDLDSDGDGILDLVESGQDAATLDADGDGMLDSTVDADNDGIVDTADNDDNDINAGGSTTPTDSDGDGMPDFQDTDSDNDGVSDLIEGGGDPSLDADNDGVIDDQTDTDGDGLADSVDPDNGGTASTGPDSDGDGLPDYQDLDSDGDGINDVDEAGGTDTDGDGQIDTGDLVDGNNLPDTDGDGTPDVEEPNNPDLPGNLDLDGDGVIDDQTDSDGDGIADSVDGLVGFGDAEQTDTDGDGIADIHDLDSDNDGILDSVEQDGDPNRDTDGDGIPDHLDLDSDGDGILDIVESGQDAATLDADGDGMLDSTVDADNDGIVDTADNDDNDINAGGSTTPTDSDGDGMPDFQDTDSDNDGVSDLIEGGGDPSLDTDNDGVIDDQTDTDGDGLADSVDPDNGGTSSTGPDTDGDGLPDYQDLDSDGDGINDVDEAGGTDTDGDGQIDTGDLVDGNNLPDTDGDGTPDVEEPNNPDLPGNLDLDGDGVIDDQTDSDGDGIADSVDGLVGFGDALTTDTDGDGIEDLYDLDSDNDGILDSVEQGGDPDRDTDGDGIPDHLDLDSDGDGILDLVESGQDASVVDTNGDGVLDSTTDADNDGIVDTADADDVDVNAGGSTNATDTDGDGNLDFQDLDSDNDGISDLIESGSDMNLDSDGDGMLDDQTDSDGDGLADSVDPDNGGSSPDIMDTDEDGNPDYQDLDSDNDGVTDLQEGGTDSSLDSDGDGVIDDISDSDGDGMMDSVDVDNGGDAPDMQDTDGDGTADYQDIDDDGDGVLTSEEDIDDDGNPNTDDTDGDGIPNYLDMDDDGDGIDTIDENPDNNGDGMPDDSLDTDEDGIPDYLDPDTLPCLTVYNEFTPNGDGQNDTFVISCIGDEMYKNNRLEVYNRWGSIVYSKSRYDNSWTGESNGRINFQVDEQLPSGTYYYVLDLGNGSEPKTGWIHINRK